MRPGTRRLSGSPEKGEEPKLQGVSQRRGSIPLGCSEWPLGRPGHSGRLGRGQQEQGPRPHPGALKIPTPCLFLTLWLFLPSFSSFSAKH